jgi:glyoxylase-like metal-dependent hydrolase (beta-lactamase superfamily II)
MMRALNEPFQFSLNGDNVLTRFVAVCAVICLLASIPTVHVAQDAKTVLANSLRAMGADNLRTLQFSATGSNAGAGEIGQNRNPNVAWPVTRLRSYTRNIDLNAEASRVDLVRVEGATNQTQTESISSRSPWNSQYSFWLTPYGFIKGAMTNNATLSSATMDGVKYNVVSFTLEGKYKVVGYINDRNLVDRVQTWIDHDVVGDMPVEAWYSGYQDFQGLKFPSLIVEKQGGFPVLVLAVSDVKPNAAVNIADTPAAASATASAAGSRVEWAKAADGVFLIKGGTHHSVAVEFSDHVVVVEAPVNEQRSLAVIAEVKQRIPNKPIRYVVNTHNHFDHAGGLRTYVDEGATIVTHEGNRAFFERAFGTPRTLNPDRLTQSRKKANIETVGDKKFLNDGVRTMELHVVRDNPHNDGILVAFLPAEKMLIEADVFTPGSATTTTVDRSTLNTVDNLERLKLDFETVLPLHGASTASRADLYTAIRKPVPDIKEILAAKPAGAAGQAAASPAQQLLDKACTNCHNLNRVQTKKLNQADWRTTVVRMKDRGAEITDEEIDTLVEFLVKSYGPGL